MKRNQSSVLYGTMVLTCTGVLSQLLGFVYRILLSRRVGAEVMGLYQLILPVFSVLLSLTAVGLTAAVSNLSAACRALGDAWALRQVLRRSLLAFLAALALWAGLAALCSDPISVFLLGDARTQLGLLLLLPCALLTGVENLHKHFFYGVGRVGLPAGVELCEQVIRAGAVLGLLAAFPRQGPEKTVGLIVLGMVLCELFSALTLAACCRRYLGPPLPLSPPPGAGRALNRRIAAVALPVGATALLGNLMGAANAVLIPQRLVAAGAEVSQAMEAFGVLCGMTLPMLGLPTCLISALGLVLAPKLAESAALGDWGAVRRRIDKALLAASVIIMPAMALLVVLGPALGAFLFHEPAVGRYMLPLSGEVLLGCYHAVLAAALNGLGRQRSAARISILCGAVQLGCTWWLMGLPGVGLAGYVAGALLSSALGAALSWRAAARTAGLRPAFYLWLTAPALSALLTGLCCNLLFRVLLDAGVRGPAAAGACLAFGGVLYLAALGAQGVRPGALFGLRPAPPAGPRTGRPR